MIRIWEYLQGGIRHHLDDMIGLYDDDGEDDDDERTCELISIDTVFRTIDRITSPNLTVPIVLYQQTSASRSKAAAACCQKGSHLRIDMPYP